MKGTAWPRASLDLGGLLIVGAGEQVFGAPGGIALWQGAVTVAIVIAGHRTS